MFLGREIPRQGRPRPARVHGREGDAAAGRGRLRRARRHRPVAVTRRSARCPAVSGRQVAIARAISWADKVVFLDEPTAALGVVQTKNVLETIKRVRAKGIAVVLISHSMPHVLEVADRVQVLRLGTPGGHLSTPRRRTVEELVGAMTGALDSERSSGMSVIHAAPNGRRVVDTGEGQQSLLQAAGQHPVRWILGVLVIIVAFFSVAGRRQVPLRVATSR